MATSQGGSTLTQEETYSFSGCKMRVTDREFIAQTHNPDTDSARYYAIDVSPVPPVRRVRPGLYQQYTQKTFKPVGLPANRVGLELDLLIDLRRITAHTRHLKASDDPEVMQAAPFHLRFTTTNADLADRAAQAISHAAELCRSMEPLPLLKRRATV
jgi:hypothetical protein